MAKFGRGEHEEATPANTRRIATATENKARVALEKRNENVYVASVRKSVTSGGTLNLHLKNPSDSGLDCNVVRATVSTRFKGQYTIYDSFSTAPSGGTAVSVDNLLMDTDDLNGGGNMTVNQDVTFTDSGSPHLADVIPSGGAGGQQVGGKNFATSPLIEPDREIVCELQNDGTESDMGAMTAVWTEENR